VIFCASDRTITTTDMEMESPVTKIYPITSSIVALPSDEDAALHEEILIDLQFAIHDRLARDPTNWLFVREVVDEYIARFHQAKKKRAEQTILLPLGLTHDAFLQLQGTMEPTLVGRISEDLVRYALPKMSALIVGIDTNGAHIYEIHEGDSGCFNTIGYAAIGAGARHAKAHFMLSGQASTTSSAETVWATYLAKKRSEVAPGVGKTTDMFMLGPRLGYSTWLNEPTMSQLHKVYEQTINHEQEARKLASKEMSEYVERISKGTSAADQEKLPAEPAPKDTSKS